MYRYSIHQFDVASDVPLPCAAGSPASPPDGTAERLIVRHERHSLQEFSRVEWLTNALQTALRVYDVGSGVLFCIEDDLRIHVDRTGTTIRLDFDLDDLLSFGFATSSTINLGVAISSFCRGALPLHAAAVEVDGRLIGLMAPSGAGKTTLLWALIDHGVRFASDDLLPVRPSDGTMWAFPSVSVHPKLSGDELLDRGMDLAALQEAVPGTREFWMPIGDTSRVTEPRPLGGLFVLRPHVDRLAPGQPVTERVVDGVALSVVLDNLQWLSGVCGVVPARHILSQCLALIDTVPIYAVRYPKRRDALPAVIDSIHRTLASDPLRPRRAVRTLRERITGPRSRGIPRSARAIT